MNSDARQDIGIERCGDFTCPLSRTKAGQVCRVKRLCASAEMCERLREIGFCEDQVVTRLANPTAIICLVCNARLALSTMLAELIWVEPITETALCT